MAASNPCESLPERPLDTLEAEITQLAAHLAAGSCRLIELIGEHDRRKGYAAHGLASTAHWLNWKCGTGMHAAREKVRVARALESLPLIHEAFGRGEVSFSKVRAMTRVATPDNESYLLTLARYGTASQLERLIASCRRAGLGVEHMARHARRYVRWHEDEEGMLVINARLPAESGALVVEALEAAADLLYEEERANVSAETSAKQEDNACGVPAQTPGAGPAPNDSMIRPASPYSRSAPLHPGLTDPDDVPAETWALWHAELPQFRRYADALCRVAETFLAAGPKAVSGADRYLINVHVRAGDLAADGGAAIDSGGKLCSEALRRIGCDASLLAVLEDETGTPLNLGRRTRSISAPLRHALEQRDGGCRFPGCTRRRWVDAHHVRHWADGGETRPDNLILLCRYHHRLVHEGGFAVIRTADDFAFRRPDGERLERGPMPPGDIGKLKFQQRRLDIDATTIYQHGCGARMDHHEAGALLAERTYPPELRPL